MRIYDKEGSLKRYLKDMEQCQIRLYKKCKELEKRIIELEKENKQLNGKYVFGIHGGSND